MHSLIKFMSEASRMIDATMNNIKSNIDFDSVNEKMTKFTTHAQDKISSLVKQVNTLRDKHIIEVPYDNQKSKFSFKIEGNVLEVGTTSNDGREQSGSRFTIPENVDMTNIRQTYDPIRKVLVFKFGKKITNN